MWQIKRQMVRPENAEDNVKLTAILMDGFEPFAVTWGGGAFDYHLRRQYRSYSYVDEG